MKIAVQIFGHLRTYQECYKKLRENLLNLYDCDVFMHTWDTIDHNTQVWHNFLVEETGQTTAQLNDIIKKIYSPKGLKIEKQIVIDEGNIVDQCSSISFFGIKSMLYGMSEANRLREEYQKKHKINYDYVLTIRPDILLGSPFKIGNFINLEDEKCFYTAGFYKSKNVLNDFRYIGASDVLFFAKPYIISNVFDNKKLIIEQIKNIETSKYGPEYSIIYAIEKIGIKPVLLNYLEGIDFKIQRGTASRTLSKEASFIKKKRKKFLNKIIRIHLRTWKLDIWILSELPWHISEFEIHIGKFFFDFAIGKRGKK